MIAHKRIGLLLAATLIVSLLAFLFITYNVGKTEASSTKLKARILRRADRRYEKLNATELDFLRKNSQEEKVEEREFKDEIPKHVPLRAKIRKEKEKEFKDLKNERWARDFELEVTNSGDRSVYEFYLLVVTDVKSATGHRVIFPVSYGRPELSDPGAKPNSDDVPLKPGESIVLKIHPGQVPAWEINQRKENRPQPRQIRVVFQGLSFGDGTGFAGDGGTPFPRKASDQTLNRCLPEPKKSKPDRPALSEWARQVSGVDLPAATVPVNFLLTLCAFKICH